jgi:PKD repeat protein
MVMAPGIRIQKNNRCRSVSLAPISHIPNSPAIKNRLIAMMRIRYATLCFSAFFALPVAAHAQCTILGPTGPVCANKAVDFTVTGPTTGTYEWDFNGDGEIDAQGLKVTYDFPNLSNDANYTVRVFRNGELCGSREVTIRATPDPDIGVPFDNGAVLDDKVIRICTGVPNVTISMFNNSATMDINESYTIDWGDGRPPQQYDNSTFNNTSLLSHEFRGYGYHNVKISVKGSKGCNNDETFQVYLGSNPSVGLGTPGNTVGLCAPVTLTFPITGTADNPAGTAYHVYINGELVANYTQRTIPNFFTYTFTETSCGQTTSTGNYKNAFDLQIIASNPCGSSTATVEPIEVSSSAEPHLEVAEEETCTGKTITIRNASTGINEVISGSPSRCENQLNASWAISPGEPGGDWVIVAGNLFSAKEIQVKFDKPGTYGITITVNSPSCGRISSTQNFTVRESPRQVGAAARFETQGGCAPGKVSFRNTTQGQGLGYRWEVSPATGWAYAAGSNANSANPEFDVREGGSYNFRFVVGTECDSITWDTVIVFSGPPEVELASPADACQTAVLNFDQTLVRYNDNGLPITEYFWEFNGASPNNSSERYPKNISYNSVGEYPYRLSVTNGCGTSTAIDTMRVLNPAAVRMPAPRKVCLSGNPIELQATPRGGIWSGPGVSADGVFRPALAGPGSHRLSYRFGVGQCAGDGDMMIEVSPGPDVQAGPDQSACVSDETFTLQGVPANGKWTDKNGFVQNNRFLPSKAGVGNHRVYYTVKDAQGCEATDSLTMKVLPPPAVRAPELLLCVHKGLVSLPEGEPAGGVWSGKGIKDNQFDPVAAGGIGVYTFKYTYTSPAGCANSTEVKADVIGPAEVDAGPDLTLCLNDPQIDLAADAKPEGGRWRAPGGGLRASIFNPSHAGVGEHKVTYEVGSGDCVIITERTIKVVEAPIIDFASIPSFICNTEHEVKLTATPAGGRWTTSSSAVVRNNALDAAATGPGEYELLYTVKMGNCEASKSLKITIGEMPKVQARDTTYCFTSGRVNLPPASPGGGTWSGPGVQGRHFYPERAGGEGEYQLTYEYQSAGCVSSALVNVTVVIPAEVNAGPDLSTCTTDSLIQLTNFSPEGGRWSGPGVVDARLGIVDPAEAGEGNFPLVYSVGSSGCLSRDTLRLRVSQPVDVGAGAPLEVCPGEAPRRLLGGSPAGGRWSGPGVVGGNFNPALVDTGMYKVIYTFTDQQAGCDVRAEKEVRVHPKPDAFFPFPLAICVNDTINFINQSSGATRYRWDFGDGGTSAEAQPRYVFTDKGSYTIALISLNSFGCADTMRRTVNVALPPMPAFAPDVNQGCAPLEVRFDNRSGGDILSYDWDFGNGVVSREADPGKIVFQQGLRDTSYVVTLTVKNECAIKFLRDTIMVRPAPTVLFGTATDTSCSPMEVRFVNRTAGNPDFFFWDFGNGNTSTDSVAPLQIYLTDKGTTIYTVTLIAGNTCGRDTASRDIVVKPVEVDAYFNIPGRQGCAPFSVNFTNLATRGAFVHWDFGDGNKSSSQNPTHVFQEAGEYTIWQYATNGCGMDSASQTIRVLPAPPVDFELPAAGCVREALAFVNRSAGIIGQNWSFGDGSVSQLRDPTHAFTKPGRYVVSLTGISAENGCPATIVKEIDIYGTPVAEFEPSIRDGCVPLRVDFRNSSEGGAYYEWNFGDGNTSTMEHPRHTFHRAGEYVIHLRVTDPNGCSEDTTVARVIAHPAPFADFSHESEILCGLPAHIQLTNESTGATGYSWDFGDGRVSTLNEPGRHTYHEAGAYDIRLIATNAFQCADTIVQTVEAFPPPEARYQIVNKQGCAPLEVTFANLSSANHFLWDFGDGNGSNAASPTHRYTRPGKYDVRLVVSYNQICFDTLTLKSEVFVYPTPTANFQMLEDRDGPPGSVEMVNLSVNATAFHWDFGDGARSEEENPRHRFLTNGKKVVRLQAANVYGCRHDTLMTIDPPFIKGLFVPNAFSPEAGVGEVRYFIPKGVGLKEYRIQIFSPYGQLVWQSDKLEEGQPAEIWDGTLNGQLLQQDVYVWKAYGIFEDGSVWRGMPGPDGKPKTIGSVTLLR